MTATTELFAALNEHDFPPGDPRRELLRAPELLRGARPVPHPALRAVRRELLSAVRGSLLSLLVGMSGVGKTRLLESLVRRLNTLLGAPCSIPAVMLVAPTAQRAVFSWKAFWIRLLTALDEPLPGDKVDPHARAAELRRRACGAMAHTTEAAYVDLVLSAAKERGLRLLVVDEATALARSESGVTLLDQIAVLRELADKNLFRIVLVSGFDILSHLRRSGVLDRRLSTVVFPRYAEALLTNGSNGEHEVSSRDVDITDPGFLAFRDTAHTFMQRLPESCRLNLSEKHFVELYRGTLGCVGQLCDWYERAVAKCLSDRDTRLTWHHFKLKPLPVDRRANLILEAHLAKEEVRLLNDLRLDLTEEEFLAIALANKGQHLSAQRARERRRSPSGLAPATKSARPRKSRSRPGIPNPKAVPLP